MGAELASGVCGGYLEVESSEAREVDPLAAEEVACDGMGGSGAAGDEVSGEVPVAASGETSGKSGIGSERGAEMEAGGEGPGICGRGAGAFGEPSIGGASVADSGGRRGAEDPQRPPASATARRAPRGVASDGLGAALRAAESLLPSDTPNQGRLGER